MYEWRKKTIDSINSAHISLPDGWSGTVSLSAPDNNHIDIQAWQKSLADIDNFAKKPDKILKSDSDTVVFIKGLSVAGKSLPAVIKCYVTNEGFAGAMRDFFRNKSLRNYRTAAALYKNNIPVVYPYAALKKKKGLFKVQYIFITEYLENSLNLHDYISENIPFDFRTAVRSFSLKKLLSAQIAQIFAGMYNRGLWHRDAKAGNLLVCKDKTTSAVTVKLVDMDGIKRYIYFGKRRGLFGLAKLVSTVIFHGGIKQTDYLRSFEIYSNLTGIKKQNRRKTFIILSQMAAGIRLLSLARSAMNIK